MKRILILLFTLIQITLSATYADGQTVESLRLKRDYYYDNLDKIIDAIGNDLNIRFVYDREHLNHYKTSFKPKMSRSEEKTVGEVLNTMRSSWNMTVHVGEDGYIYIARNREHLEQLQSSNKAATTKQLVQQQESRSAGQPVKRNFTATGEVFDNQTGERIPYATVAIKGSTHYGITDANGRFTLTQVPADCPYRRYRHFRRTHHLPLSLGNLSKTADLVSEMQICKKGKSTNKHKSEESVPPRPSLNQQQRNKQSCMQY